MSETVADIQELLGEFGKLLYFMEEGDVVLAKPKQLLSKETFEALRRRVEEMGGQCGSEHVFTSKNMLAICLTRVRNSPGIPLHV